MFLNVKQFNARVLVLMLIPLLMAIVWSSRVYGVAYASAGPAFYGPALPKFGLYSESVEDMRVKVQGGYIRVTRTRRDRTWYFNHRWSTLHRGPSTKPVSTSSCSGGCVSYAGTTNTGGTSLSINDNPYDFEYVKRSGSLYKNVGKDRYVVESNPRLTITERNTEEGYQDFLWEDHEGNWIDYKINGQIESYGDKNNVKVTFKYDDNYNLTGVFDTLGNQILWYEYNTANQISAIRDYTGRKVQYFYLDTTSNHISKVIDVNGNEWLYEYVDGRLTRKTDPEGRIINIVGPRVLESVLDQDGIGTYYSYEYNKTENAFYRQEKTTGGKVTEYWFDKDGDMVRKDINGTTLYRLEKSGSTHTITDEKGLKTIKQYDTLKNLTRTTYPDDSTVSYSIDTKYSNITQKTDQKGIITRYEYDANGNLKKKTEAEGRTEERVTEYDYDAYGNVTHIRRLADANTELAEVVLTYDNYGNIATYQDAETNITRFNDYDVAGKPHTVTDARNKVWLLDYDAKGNLTKITDPLDRDIDLIYDKVDNLVQVIDIARRTTVYGYNNQHRLSSITHPDTSVYRYEYHPDGMVSKIIDESGIATSYKYDISGRILEIIDGNGNITKQVFDTTGDYKKGGFNNAWKIIYPTYEYQMEYDKRGREVLFALIDGEAGAEYRYAYDATGNVTQYVNAENQTHVREYNAYNQVTKYTDNLLHDTLVDYDDRGNLIKLTDAKLQEHRFSYYRNNQLKSEIRPMGEILQFFYDGTGNLIDRIDARNQKITHVYDEAGRHTDTHYYAAGNHIDSVQRINYGYDAGDNNNSWSITGNTDTDRNMSGSAVYNDRNWLTSETINFGPFSKTYSYDYFDNGDKKTTTYPESTVYSYSYDAAGLLSAVNIPGKGNSTINSRKWLAAEKITLPGGSTFNFNVDNRLATTGITFKDPAMNVITQQQLTLNKLQNITQKVIDNATYDYSYDDENRLTGVDKNTSAINRFTLDAVGNRLTLNGSAEWQYNANNELESQGGVSYSYDDNGNQTQRTTTGDTRNFIYDIDNQLVRINDGADQQIARYGYSPFAQRLWKQTGTQTTYYLYSDEGLIAEYNASGQLQQSYGYKPDSVWSTAPIFTARNGEYYYYLNDHPTAGKSQKLIAANGQEVWSADYDVFGQAVVASGSTIENNLRLAGQYYDAETGLHYNWHRYYDTETGRYITFDPIGLNGGGNGYVYGLSDPVNFIDPNGLWVIPVARYVLPKVGNWIRTAIGGYSLALLLEQTMNNSNNNGNGNGNGNDDSESNNDSGSGPSVCPIPDTGNPMPPNNGDDGDDDGDGFENNQQADEKAKELGFKKIKERSHGQNVYKKGNKYISRDVDSHNGGAWKMAENSPKNLRSKKTRMGTFNRNLTRRIGD